jgi:class 3 adenylate cyclase
MASHHPEGFPSTRAIVLLADLSGFHRGFAAHTDAEMARFLDRFYRTAEDVITGFRGRVVKFLGDAVLAVFEEDDAALAVSAAVSLESATEGLTNQAGLDMRLGANIHAGDVVYAEFGHGTSRRADVIGRVVNQTFLLGRGAGIRVSERVYRALPSGDRSPWERRKPPAVYVLGASAEPYESLRKTAAENAARW